MYLCYAISKENQWGVNMFSLNTYCVLNVTINFKVKQR